MYFSARSASWAPLLFQQMTRCHSVFSCFSPPCPVHWRLVARDKVATRDPVLVLRTSGSAPKFPISMILLRLRLTTYLPSVRRAGVQDAHIIWVARLSVNQRYATFPSIRVTPPPAPPLVPKNTPSST